jgi:hypothetical protein
MKIRPVRAQFSMLTGLTDRHDTTNSRFSQVCERAQHYRVTIQYLDLRCFCMDTSHPH